MARPQRNYPTRSKQALAVGAVTALLALPVLLAGPARWGREGTRARSAAEALPVSPQPRLLSSVVALAAAGLLLVAGTSCLATRVIRPALAAAYLARGTAHYREGEDARAIADLTEALLLDPNQAEAHRTRAWAHHDQGDYDAAIRDYSRALELDPEDPSAYDDLAWLLATCPEARHRSGTEALVHATRACELTQWTDPDCLDTLAAACAEAGEFDQAAEWQAKALELVTPDDDKTGGEARLRLYNRRRPYREET